MNILIRWVSIVLLTLNTRFVEGLEIKIDGTNHNEVEITYVSEHLTSHITLATETGERRAELWHFSNPEFTLTLEKGREVIRRADGALFRSVSFSLPKETTLIPKQYPPILRYSEGSFLLYTGILRACSETCDTAHSSRFKLSLKVKTDQSIWVRGKYRGTEYAWESVSEGEMVLVANSGFKPSENAVFLDPNLPSTFTDTINRYLVALKSYFEIIYGKPEEDPVIFASFDPHVKWGNGHEGGTLKNQLFMHWYGSKWHGDIDVNELLLFLAHELAHLYFGDELHNEEEDEQWIHEGAAELSSIRAMEHINRIPQEMADSLIMNAKRKCDELRSISTQRSHMPTTLKIEAQYKCGLAYWADLEQIMSQNQLSYTELINELSARAKQEGMLNTRLFFSVLSNFIDPSSTNSSLIRIDNASETKMGELPHPEFR